MFILGDFNSSNPSTSLTPKLRRGVKNYRDVWPNQEMTSSSQLLGCFLNNQGSSGLEVKTHTRIRDGRISLTELESLILRHSGAHTSRITRATMSFVWNTAFMGLTTKIAILHARSSASLGQSETCLSAEPETSFHVIKSNT